MNNLEIVKAVLGDFRKRINLLFATAIGVFCFLPKTITLFVILLFISLIFGVVKKKISFTLNKKLMLFTLFYITYALGVLFTHNHELAKMYLENKLVFLLFPFLFSFNFFDNNTIRFISIGMIIGMIVSSFLGLIHSLNCFSLTHDYDTSFSTVFFSYIHHPSYFSAFLSFTILLALNGLRLRWSYFSSFNVTIFCLFSIVMLAFCMSLAGLLFFGIMLMTFFIFLGFRYLKRVYLILAISLLPLFPIVIYFLSSNVRIEVNTAYSSLTSFFDSNSDKSKLTSGSDTRMIMWSTALDEFLEHPLGVGTGNVDEYLSKNLKSKGLDELAVFNYNPHNQFLQTGLEIGVVGLFILLLIIILPLYHGFKSRNWLLIFIALNLAFNALFESMLQRQSGIIFYTFWICLLLALKDSKLLNNPSKNHSI